MAFFIAIEYAILQPIEMCKVAMVCKQAEAYMTRAWKHIAPPSSNDTHDGEVCCKHCPKKAYAWGMCTHHIREVRLISPTEAKKLFFLQPSMLLEHLECTQRNSHYNRSQVICKYLWREVLDLALRVHKGPKAILERQQKQKQKRENPSKAQLTRKQAIEKHMQTGGALHAMTSTEAWAQCAAPFVANGSGGGVSGVIRAFKLFAHRQRRREELQAALQVHGLSLRSDSRLCKAFVEETKRHKTLAETVQTMREMDWLHKNTNYAQQMRDACRNIGSSIRAEYDDEWIPQPLYDELCTEAREKVSEKLRRKLLPSTLRL